MNSILKSYRKSYLNVLLPALAFCWIERAESALISCVDAGIATLATTDYFNEVAFYGDGTGIPQPLALEDLCKNTSKLYSQEIQSVIQKASRLNSQLSIALYGEKFSKLLPEGIHLLLVTDTPGGEVFSSGPSTVQTTLNSTPSGYSGGAISLLNSVKINLPKSTLESFDESIYTHEITHTLLASSHYLKKFYPLLIELNQKSSHFAEFFCDLSAFLSTGRVLQLDKFQPLLEIRDLAKLPYNYLLSNKEEMTIARAAKVLLDFSSELGFDDKAIEALKQTVSSTDRRLDPHLTGVSFGRLLVKIPAPDLISALKESLKSGKTAQDWLNAILVNMSLEQRETFEKDLSDFKARNWIRYLDSNNIDDLLQP
ncbi:MAG: hypothetical protein KA715_14420 [Xanthomonadaceae bacterium]|nr:hypothetical protein [Xanthomonadaceae bacterium]